MIGDCTKSITYRCETGRFAVRDLLARAKDQLGAWDVPEDMRDTTEIVLGEALNNVVEHAYREEAGHPIQLGLALAQKELTCTITDQGCPIPNGQVPRGAEPELNVAQDALPEGGFGWLMIHTLAESVQYIRAQDSNILTIHLRVV